VFRPQMILLLPLIVAMAIDVQAKPPEQIYKEALPSVLTLLVEKKDGTHTQGSAFLAMDHGLAVTAWHVVKDAKRVVAKFATEEEFEVSGIVDKDEKRDLAIIRVKVYGRPLMTMEGDEPEVGSKAYVIGSPRGLGYSISDGLVSQVRTLEGIKEFQFTCPASPGSSGGPLVNEVGKVIGVVASQIRAGQNLNFAVPSVYVLDLDRSLPTQPWPEVKAVTQEDGTDGMVYVSDYKFYIDRYEVSNSRYAVFLNVIGNLYEGGAAWLDVGSRRSLIIESSGKFTPKRGYGDHPVVKVSWYGAKAYCEWAGKRLPTEREWQQACQGTDDREYPWGDSCGWGNANIRESGDGREKAVADRRPFGELTDEEMLQRMNAQPPLVSGKAPVGSFPNGISPYGAMDMSGNVREWTLSLFKSGENARVLRGGSWTNAAKDARCESRTFNNQDDGDHFIGFRCAR
jgi:formylglycine-generating enzyme required for sulfatase activity